MKEPVIPNQWDKGKALLQRNFIALNAFIIKEVIVRENNARGLSTNIQKLGRKKRRRRKRTTK